MRPPSEEAIAITGQQYLWWCVQEALDAGCHLVWWELSDGGIQPIFWFLPGDEGYDETNEEMPDLQRAHN